LGEALSLVGPCCSELAYESVNEPVTKEVASAGPVAAVSPPASCRMGVPYSSSATVLASPAQVDLSLMVKSGVQYSLWGGSVINLGRWGMGHPDGCHDKRLHAGEGNSSACSPTCDSLWPGS
jgi:hypothetical protein